MTVIPQSPPIKVRVTLIAKAGDVWGVESEYPAYIVGWQVKPDDDLADMIPIVWTSGDGQAFALSGGKESRFQLDEVRGEDQ